MKTLNEIKPAIKDAIWELKQQGKTITLYSLMLQAGDTLDYLDLPVISDYLYSIKDSFLWTRCKGYLELTPIGKATVNDLVSNAR